MGLLLGLPMLPPPPPVGGASLLSPLPPSPPRAAGPRRSARASGPTMRRQWRVVRQARCLALLLLLRARGTTLRWSRTHERHHHAPSIRALSFAALAAGRARASGLDRAMPGRELLCNALCEGRVCLAASLQRAGEKEGADCGGAACVKGARGRVALRGSGCFAGVAVRGTEKLRFVLLVGGGSGREETRTVHRLAAQQHHASPAAGSPHTLKPHLLSRLLPLSLILAPSLAGADDPDRIISITITIPSPTVPPAKPPRRRASERERTL
jgi:hypothetical protein